MFVKNLSLECLVYVRYVRSQYYYYHYYYY